jgi:hypothetical protein
MTNDTGKAASPPAEAAVSVVRIVPEIPLLFADAVKSHAYGTGISKFYFVRTDADPDATRTPKEVVVAQIVMPTIGFAKMVHFLQHRLDVMLKEGGISQEALDEIRAVQHPDPVPMS